MMPHSRYAWDLWPIQTRPVRALPCAPCTSPKCKHKRLHAARLHQAGQSVEQPGERSCMSGINALLNAAIVSQARARKQGRHGSNALSSVVSCIRMRGSENEFHCQGHDSRCLRESTPPGVAGACRGQGYLSARGRRASLTGPPPRAPRAGCRGAPVHLRPHPPAPRSPARSRGTLPELSVGKLTPGQLKHLFYHE